MLQSQVAKKIVIFVKAKKLGDALVAASSVFCFSHQNESRLLIIAPTAYRQVFAAYGLKSKFYGNELQLLILVMKLRIANWAKGIKIDLLGVTGLSGNFQTLKFLLSPSNSVWRTRDFVCSSNGEVAKLTHTDFQTEYCNKVLELYDPNFIPNKFLECPPKYSLTGLRTLSVLSPNSAEKRRSMTREAFLKVFHKLSEQEGVTPLILLNDDDYNQVISREFVKKNLPNARIVSPKGFEALSELFCSLRSIHTVDTSFYVIASMLKVPEITVYFGPTEPLKARYTSEQNNIFVNRSRRLGEKHCDNQSCTVSFCINDSVGIAPDFEKIPKRCLLRT